MLPLTGVLDSMGTRVCPMPDAIMARANLAYTSSAGVVCVLGLGEGALEPLAGGVCSSGVLCLAGGGC